MQPLLVTMGDPTGIGPELIVQTLAQGIFHQLQHQVQVVGDIGVLEQAAATLGLEVGITQKDKQYFGLSLANFNVNIYSGSQINVDSIQYGQPDHLCGTAMAEYVNLAISRCLEGHAAGIITCPINKSAINAAGYHFPGHTELLAERCGVEKVVMMLAGEKLKVCLVTTHLPLRDVSDQLTVEEIFQTILITNRSLRQQFGIKRPRIAVLALNPHAGEGGLFGDEEQKLITPAISQAQCEDIDVSGPQSADTLFHFAVQGRYDAVICMYHDQGLIPLKLLHFDDAVNVTLGLPIVRTSVDHGTAYDLVGTGQANNASLIAALKVADKMAMSQKNISLTD